jgi:hypothetical protein
MYFFHERLASYAVEYFQACPFNSPAEADGFFGLFAPGNTIYFAERPHERFSDYEELLARMMQADPEKYRRIHKGTPFYFMSWLAFDLRNHEKGLFYIDAAISEDVRNANPPPTWINNPGPRFLLLDPTNQAAARTVGAVRQLLVQELTRFNRISGQPPLDIDVSWQRFVQNLLTDPKLRTIISAFYVFLLEFDERFRELSLREGSSGGSNQPFTVHLFTGGLLFESLLKQSYPFDDQGQPNTTLGAVLHTRSFLRDFRFAEAPSSTAQSLAEIHSGLQGNSSIQTAFATAAKLRNTTGHNLVWDDIFSTPRQYVELFEQVMNALLFVVSKLV